MDQDFYIEETSKVKIAFGILILVGLISYGIYAYFHYYDAVKVHLNNITVELGSKLPTDINKYIETKHIDSYKLDVSNVSVDENGNTNSLGEYSYKVSNEKDTLKGKIFVKDTTKPAVEVQELTVGVKEEFVPADFVTKCDDLSLPCVVKYKKLSDETLNDKEGVYNIKISIKDAAGNEVIKDVKLNVQNNASLKATKESDLNYSYTSMENNTWNQTYTLKLDKAVEIESHDYEELISDISNKEYAFDKEIKSKEIIVIYNRYDYAIGFSIMFTFSDDSVIFVTAENAVEKSEDQTE